MKRIFVCLAMALMVALGPVGTVYALSDAEYKELLKDPDFRFEDALLGKVWKRVYGSLRAEKKKILLADQRDWLKNRRDACAEDYMNQGESKVQAYILAVNSRSYALQMIEDASLGPVIDIAAVPDSLLPANSLQKKQDNGGYTVSNARPDNYNNDVGESKDFLHKTVQWMSWRGKKTATKVTPYHLAAGMIMSGYSVEFVQVGPTTYKLNWQIVGGIPQMLHVGDFIFEDVPGTNTVVLTRGTYNYVAFSGERQDQEFRNWTKNTQDALGKIPNDVVINIR